MKLKSKKSRLQLFALFEVAAILGSLAVAAVFAPPAQDFKEFAAIMAYLVPVATVLNAVVTPILTREADRSERTESDRRETYMELAKAAHNFYGALSSLETGDWDAAKFADAEARMKEAGALAKQLNEAQEAIWLAFHQQGLNIAATATNAAHAKADRIAYWKSAVGDFADQLGRIDALEQFE
jgi:hypothetical protein